MNPAPLIQTEVRYTDDMLVMWSAYGLGNAFVLLIRRSDFSRRALILPHGARDISCHAGQTGQVSGYDPTTTPLLRQVLPQHIPDRSRTVHHFDFSSQILIPDQLNI